MVLFFGLIFPVSSPWKFFGRRPCLDVELLPKYLQYSCKNNKNTNDMAHNLLK